MLKIGRYVVLKELGRGAMGLVYAASDPDIGRTVAIKTIRIHEIENAPERQELRERLRREAQSAGALSHPGIVTIFDMGEQGNDAYIVMEYVDGNTLEEVFTTGVPQHSDFLLRVLKKAGEALDYAHSKGIIHRDIKPSNIMITKDGSVKITDFGVAKISASTSMTSTGFVLGTPNYMSPEQAQAHPIDGRSDQFSLAVLAHRVLTGKLPFYASTLTGVLSKILWSQPDFVDTSIPPEVQTVLLKALSKEPQQRYSTCAEFAQELERAWSATKPGQLPVSPDHTPAAASRVIQAAAPPSTSEEVTAEINIRDKSGRVSTPPDAGVSTLDQIAPSKAGEPSISGTAQPEAASSKPPGTSEASREPRRLWVIGALLALATVLAGGSLGYLYLTRQKPPADSAQESAQPEPVPQLADAPKEMTSVPSRPQPETASPPIPPQAPEVPQKQRGAATPPLVEPRKELRNQPPTTSRDEKSKTEVAMQPEGRTASAPASGLITWTGRLNNNSILVISAKGASIGAISGQLPGTPVNIEVDPASVVIRVRPNEQNGWREIVLATGTERRESITIRWTAIR